MVAERERIQELNEMPIHDWTRVDAGLFHHFHCQWASTLCNALNTGTLPPDHFALVEQHVSGPIADVLTIELPAPSNGSTSGTATQTIPTTAPRTTFIQRTEADRYAARANRITVRHQLGDVVAVIEIISPGNKSSRDALAAFVRKSVELIRHGINLLIIDLFPPSQRDPQGIHRAIWDVFEEGDFEVPLGKPLTLVSYEAGSAYTAYVEPVAVGDVLPEMPIFLGTQRHVPAPLESSYQATWDLLPAPLRSLLQGTDTSGD